MSKSGRAKSHPVDRHAYRSRANINQNNLLLHSSSLQSAAGGMILVLLKLGAGALLGVKFDAARSSSEVKPRCTAERVKSANIPHEDGPCSEPIKSRARRANACTEDIEVDSIA